MVIRFALAAFEPLDIACETSLALPWPNPNLPFLSPMATSAEKLIVFPP
jgi:hypothetical protein